MEKRAQTTEPHRLRMKCNWGWRKYTLNTLQYFAVRLKKMHIINKH